MPNAHILGLGKSGIAAAKLLKAKGWQVLAIDEGSNPNSLGASITASHRGIATSLGQPFQALLNNQKHRDTGDHNAANSMRSI
jgi:UDP-N-acetylmuramoylalanine--D-glutamate ligase